MVGVGTLALHCWVASAVQVGVHPLGLGAARSAVPRLQVSGAEVAQLRVDWSFLDAAFLITCVHERLLQRARAPGGGPSALAAPAQGPKRGR